ncbi:hypothetical protein VTN00DRAFT_6855 [Thermoascus crustaceus]|uniref:uncharacterized protein n=1 Tax=Thermoascus crustaceus TaxID=5088 RepID=UPI0037438B6C
MNLVVQNPQDPRINAGLNNLVAKETYAVARSKVSEGNEQTSPQSPAERPKYQLWPMLKRAVPSPSGRVHELMTSQSSPSLRETGMQLPFGSTIIKLKHPKEGPLMRRRKISFPELGTGPMTTVQEHYMDSPTIPGRYPVHERSNSAPGSSWGRSPFEDIILEPVSEPVILSPEGNDRKPRPSPSGDNETGGQDQKSLETSTKESSAADPEPEKPPAVPPKSPRTVLRKPSTAQPPKSRFNAPLATDISLNNQASTTSSPGESASPSHITSQWPGAHSRPRAATALDGRRSPHMWNLLSRSESCRHKRSESASAGTGVTGGTQEQNRAVRREHKRDFSETSIMDRGRPPKKDRSLATKMSKRRPSEENMPFLTLPSGLTPQDASSVLSPEDIERLQEQARCQAEKFEVLKYSEVKKLSQELRVLDERCEYLRNTHNSLRSGRRNLHERMVTYLKSPRLSKFCRESMLKQEEALAELDQSIDEWVTKLEHAENRRTRVRQKLLEHMAAVLVLQTNKAGSQAFKEQTPPQSPTKTNDQPGVNRKDVESIKVYADSRVYADAKVYALFADIEKEMELMAEIRNGSSSRQDDIALA